jgi:hypothetical protein
MKIRKGTINKKSKKIASDIGRKYIVVLIIPDYLE